MGSEKEAEDAAKALNGTKLLGRQVRQWSMTMTMTLNYDDIGMISEWSENPRLQLGPNFK